MNFSCYIQEFRNN